MSFIGDLAETLSGTSGSLNGNYRAPGLQNPVTNPQIDQAYGQTQQGINQQQSFLQALQAQNGIQNQSDVYNQLGQIAQGQGPNPAQAMLANSTGANIANQAALMAGQRGAGANPALIARQAALQGGAIQQNAAGQAAALQAQQSLGAIGQQSGIAGQQVGNQANALANYSNMAQAQQNALLGAQSNFNQAQVGAAGVNAGIAQHNQAAKNAFIGNAFGAAGAGVTGMTGGAGNPAPGQQPGAGGGATGGAQTMAMEAQGGMIHAYADGGQVGSFVGRYFKGMPMDPTPMAKGGEVPAVLSPGERYLSPKDVKKVAQGKEDPAKSGRKVPGKAKVSGDSLKNDVVPAKLEEGGIVIPRSVMNSKDPSNAAAKFVEAVLAKQNMKRK